MGSLFVPPSLTPPGSHVEALIPMWCYLEVGPGRPESGNEGEALMMGSAPWSSAWEEKRASLRSLLCEKEREGIHLQARRRALTRNGIGRHSISDVQPLDLWEIHICCGRPAVCGMCYCSPSSDPICSPTLKESTLQSPLNALKLWHSPCFS